MRDFFTALTFAVVIVDNRQGQQSRDTSGRPQAGPQSLPAMPGVPFAQDGRRTLMAAA